MDVDSTGHGTDRETSLEKNLEEVISEVDTLINTVNNPPREERGRQQTSWKGRQWEQKNSGEPKGDSKMQWRKNHKKKKL